MRVQAMAPALRVIASFAFLCIGHLCYAQDNEQTVTLIGSRQLNLNLKCPPSLPVPCSDVVSDDPRVKMTLWDGLEVLCDTKTDGGGWLVIQRRFDGDLDFYRDWDEYKYGFGNVSNEFWFGNEKVHRLTIQRHYELRVDFKHQGQDYHATYSSFRLHSEAENYRLEIGSYTGNAGDSLIRMNNMGFSTKDRDNDIFSGDCAELYHGAWWYDQCHESNLNGLWGSTAYGTGLNWRATTNYYSSATFTEMKIRQVK